MSTRAGPHPYTVITWYVLVLVLVLVFGYSAAANAGGLIA